MNAKELIKRLEAAAEIDPKAEVVFCVHGDGFNDGWPICGSYAVSDGAGGSRIVLVNDEKVIE
ncbi:hypothetical protein VJ923_07210 [Adlercreutzia sp. R25]|uniref:hypothetical protein n=1 Tax=Adlercreutzia shanghongiae TaxID=3111773 RepID=UPI002DBA5353|nr:hypothetical protein [Adlercreutzia sp. R25]MEC4272942.1 hypothetical protein [Adlercreutzia sp. R25]